jgi:hypothetical protein
VDALFSYFSALTFLGTILNVLPIARPFLAPFKGQAAGCADLGREAVLGLCDHFLSSAQV